MRCNKCDYRLWNLPSRRCPECGTEFLPSEFEFVTNSVRFCCPHCGQAYYGTGPKGHLVPYEFDCVSCGRRINMDEMILLPAEGVSEQQTSVGEVPWFERRKLGFFKAWFRTIGMALGSPLTLSRILINDHDSGTGWWFALLTVTISLGIGSVFPCGLPFVIGAGLGGGAGNALGLILAPVIGIVVFVLLVFLILVGWSAVTHVMLVLMNGNNEPFRRTAQAICFSGGAGVCLAIPCLGPYGLGWLWWIVSAILMVKEGQRIGGGKATVAVITAPLLTVMILGGGYMFMMYMVMTRMPTMTTTAPAAVYVQTQSVSTAMKNYALAHRGRRPGHVIELANENYLNYADFCTPSSGLTEADIPIGDTTLDKVEMMSREERDALARKAADALPADTIAYRFGDFVFTYPGIKPRNPDPQLWLFVQVPENANPSSFQMVMYEMARTDGTTTMGFSNDFSRVLKEQNKVRVRNGLPPLPDLRNVTHAKPAVAPGWRPASQPASDESP